jgi:hypothetical protein
MIHMGIREFIEKFRENIIERVAQDSKPLYRPGQDRKAAYDLIKHISRRPIACQIDAIDGRLIPNYRKPFDLLALTNAEVQKERAVPPKKHGPFEIWLPGRDSLRLRSG